MKLFNTLRIYSTILFATFLCYASLHASKVSEKGCMVFDNGQKPAPVASLPYRMVAEWEPAIGTLISWPLLIPHSLAVELAKDDSLYVLVADTASKNEAEKMFNMWELNVNHVHWLYIDAGPSAPWTRDWGPFSVFDSSKKFLLADADFRDDPNASLYPISIFDKKMTIAVQDSYHLLSTWDFIKDYEYDTNAIVLRIAKTGEKKPWSYKDSLGWYASFVSSDPVADISAPTDIARALGIKSNKISLAITGGNALVDGHGTVFSNCIMFNENYHTLGLSPQNLINRARKELGVQRYIFIPYFEDFGIQHIDCFLKILNEETILIAQPPKNHPSYKVYHDITQFLASQKTVFGRKFTIIPIATPAYHFDYLPAYTNALILNKKVLVPLFNIPQDSIALQTYRDAMPGYTVIGFQSEDSPKPWKWYDAIHCRARTIADPKMLFISHKRLDNKINKKKPIVVKVTILDYSLTGLCDDKLKTLYRIQGETNWKEIKLTRQKTEYDYSCVIPNASLKPGDVVEYFIEATNNEGKRETKPCTAPEGFYSVTIY